MKFDEKTISRFNNKLSSPDINGCINFNGEILSSGYGRMCINYKKIVAHRISYIINFGSIPKGKLVLHKCDNRKCVNPYHLFIGSYQDNMDDKVNKNRQSKGVSTNIAKLTDELVKNIRLDISLGFISLKKLAKKYKISYPTILDIKRKRTWKHI
jgi:hypothetical protein